MSTISTAYDALKARLLAVLPNHSQMTNPYAPEQNSEQILRKSYGLRISTAENTNRQVSCQLSIRRTMEVVITRKYFASEMNRTAKETVEKDLMEDAFLVIKDIEKDADLGNNVANILYQSDTGIEFVFSEDKPFFMTTLTFGLEYFENLN